MKGIIVTYQFKPDEVRESIQNIFNNTEDKLIIRSQQIRCRLNNGNQFDIKLNRIEGFCSIYIKRKYTSLHPDIEWNAYHSDLEDILSLIKSDLDILNKV